MKLRRLSPKRIRNRHLRTLAVFSVLALGPLGLLTFLSIRLGDQAVHNQVQQRITEASTTASTLVGQQMGDLADLVESYAQRHSLQNALNGSAATATTQSNLVSALNDLKHSQSGVALAFLTDRKGKLLNIVPATPSIVGVNFSYRDWYKGVMRTGQPYISDAYQTAATGHARVVAASALIRGTATAGKPGPILGIVVAAYNLNTIQHFVDRFASANNVALTVTDQNGTVVAAPGVENTPKALISLKQTPAIKAALAGKSGTVQTGNGSKQVLSAYTPVSGLGWTIRADIPTSIAYASSRHLRNTVAIIAGIFAVLLIAGLILLGINMRRRDRSELRREESEAFLDSVIENIPNMVFIKDAGDLRFVRLNKAAEDLLGYQREELLAKNDHDFFPPEQADFFRANDLDVLATREVVDIPEETVVTKSGVERVLHTKKIPMFDASGMPQYLLGISEDISEYRASRLALAQAKEDAERANAAKNDFLSHTSHELRTPLNAILGFSQLLEMSNLNDLDRDSNAHILKAGRHLLALINELLDLSRIEARELSLSLEPILLSTVIDEVTELMTPLAAARGLTVTYDCADPNLTIVADRQRFSQILLNLVSNAVKYNRENGHIEIACRIADDASVDVIVADTGPGLSTDDLERVFLPFERLHAGNSEIEGSGIGLTLSAALAEAMGGRISVESELGRGTTFIIHIPQAIARPIASTETLTIDRNGQQELNNGRPLEVLRVLYIEDNIANIQIVERFLGGRPSTTLHTAMTGQLGLDLARQHHPDLILLDLHLPDLAGDEVFERLRSDPQTAAIPVVMLSADATPGAVDRMLGRGVMEYLTKPLDLSALATVLDNVTGSSHTL